MKRWKQDGENVVCEKATKKMFLRTHVLIEHKGVRFPCNQCDYKAIEKKLLKCHITDKQAGCVLTCDRCDPATCPKEELKDLMRSVHANPTNHYRLCNFNTNQPNHLQTHSRPILNSSATPVRNVRKKDPKDAARVVDSKEDTQLEDNGNEILMKDPETGSLQQATENVVCRKTTKKISLRMQVEVP